MEILVSGKRCPHRLPVLIIVHAGGRGHRGRSVFPDPRDLYDDLWDLHITNTYQLILPPWRNVRHFLLTTIKIAARIILIEKSHFFLHHYLICGGNWGYFSRYMTKWFFVLFFNIPQNKCKTTWQWGVFPLQTRPFHITCELITSLE